MLGKAKEALCFSTMFLISTAKISLNKITRWGLRRQVMLEQIVDSKLKNTEYPQDNQINDLIKSWCKNKQLKGEEELKIWKKKNGFNEDQWNDYITRKWRWTKWCMDKFRERIPNYYLEKKSMLDKVQYSLIRVSSENLANELYLRINEKESTFEEIAKKYSEAFKNWLPKVKGKFIIRDYDTIEEENGNGNLSAVVEFPSKEAAIDAYNSEEYQSMISLRKPFSEISLIICKGC